MKVGTKWFHPLIFSNFYSIKYNFILISKDEKIKSLLDKKKELKNFSIKTMLYIIIKEE